MTLPIVATVAAEAPEIAPKIAVSEQEVTDFFNANRAQFNLAEESYRIAQIAVTPVRDQQIANQTGDDAATPQGSIIRPRTIGLRADWSL